MLRFIAVEEPWKNAVCLRNGQDVEREFFEFLNFHDYAFWDEDSLLAMKKIDSARRRGDYGVITPFGESCISCLSIGCKFALTVLFYKQYYQAKLLVQWDVAGMDVWEWLADNVDYEVYICKEHLIEEMMRIDAIEVLYEENLYRGESEAFCNIVSEALQFPYQMTPKKESKAYHWAKQMEGNMVHIPLKEEVDLISFLKRFSDLSCCFSDKEPFQNFTVVNYCSYLPDEFLYKRQPVYVCGTGKDGVKFQETYMIGDTFAPNFVFDLLHGVWEAQDSQKENEKEGSKLEYRELFTSWFVLVLDEYQRCSAEHYAEETLFGVEVNQEKRKITIYDSKQAVEQFHILYRKIQK